MRSRVFLVLFGAVLLSVFGCGNSSSVDAAKKHAAPAKAQTTTVMPVAPAAKPDSSKASTPAPALKADEKKATAPALAPAKMEVVKEWDFIKLDKAQWAWTFPGNTPQATPYGVTYQVDAKGKDVGPMYQSKLNLSAGDVKTVRVCLFVRQQAADGTHVPAPGAPLELWFARSEDVGPGDYWKGMKKSFGVGLKPVPGIPNAYDANVASSPEWKGTIDRMHLVVNSEADPAKGKVFVFVQNIQMLK